MIRAGVGRACITPPLDIPNGMWMAQRHIRPDGLHLDLWVTALVLEDEGEQLAMLDFDLCVLSDQQAAAIREAVSGATGIAHRRILPCCTHNHAGPVTQDFYAGEGADRVKGYVASLPHHAAGAARAALLSLGEVRIAAGAGISGIGVNRDLSLETGRIVTGPNPAGFSDTEVGVIRLDRPDGTPLACLVNYACHPTVLGPENRLISPDYPGVTKRVVERNSGAVCLFLQGAAGNMGPVEGFVGDFRVADRLGALLGLEAARVFLGLDTSGTRRRLSHVLESGAPLTQYVSEPVEQPPARLRVTDRDVSLPIRTSIPELYSNAPERLALWSAELERRQSAGAPPSDVAYALQQVERERLRLSRVEKFFASTHVSVEMHGVALGNIGLLLMWGEPYSQIGAEVKRRSPFARTLFATCVGGDANYIPWPDAYLPQPPFEVENSPFSPEAAGIAVEAALRLLADLQA